MKSNNDYLRTINKNFGDEVHSMKSDNYYLKNIAKNTGSDDINGHHPNNYYLKRISENTGDMDIAELNATIQELRNDVDEWSFKANNELVLLRNNPVVQTDDTVSVFVYCKSDGENADNETIYFYGKESNMTNYRYLGSVLTNENGVATLEYTGIGAGKLDIVASLDNPISDDSIMSEPSTVIDAWFKDKGITGNCNDDDWVVQTQVGSKKTVQSDGTLFEGYTGDLFAWINKHGTTHTTLDTIAEFGGDYGIELTVVDITGTVNFGIYEAFPSSKRVAVPLSVGKWLIKRINNVVTAFKDDVAYPISSQSLSAPQRLGLVASQGNSIKVKDVAVYGFGGTELGLTASKQLIESGETTTLSAYLSEGSGETVQLYNADTDALIGTMTDAGDGIYTYSVTGTGSGQKRYYAKYGGIVSQLCTVWDTLFYDSGVTTNPPYDDMWVDSGSISSRDNTGILLSNSTGSNQFYRANKHGTTTSDYYDWDNPFCIEYDVVSITNPTNINSHIYDNSSDTTIKSMNAIGVTDACHVKITYDGSVMKYYIDDVETASINITTSNKFQIAFRLGTGASLKIKNFLIYSI